MNTKAIEIFLLISSIVLISIGNCISQTSHKLSSNTYVKEYAIAGPFSGPEYSAENFQDLLDVPFLIDENSLNISSLGFVPVKVNDQDVLDFNKSFTDTSYAIAYAALQITSEKKSKALLVFRADDGVKILVNGKAIHAANYSGWGWTTDHKSITLNEGSNTLLFKIANRTHNWELKLKILDDLQGDKYLEKIEEENQYLQFLSNNLKPTIDKNFSYSFFPGKFPKLHFDKGLLAKKYLGGSYSIETRWFDANLNEVVYPKSPGRYAYHSLITGANGIQLKRSKTLFCAPSGWMGWNERPVANLEYLPINDFSAEVWTKHQKAIGEYLGFDFLKSTLLNEDVSVLLAFIDEMNKNPREAGPSNTPIIMDGDYHVKLKQKILNRSDYYPLLASPKMKSDKSSKLTVDPNVSIAFQEKIRKIAHDWMGDNGAPFDMLLAQNGKILIQESFGEDSYGKFTSETSSEIASITKLLTGILFAQFVDQGLIGIDDYVGKYLPDVPTSGPNALTLRHCFTHTNGFDGHGIFGGVHNPWLENTLIQVIKNDTVGTKHNYNGLGYDLAGKVMEIVSGKSIFRLFREHLYEPLAMEHTFHDWDLGYSCHSTAEDLAKVAQLILNKGSYNGMQFFSPETFEAILPRDLEEFYPTVKQKWGIGLTMMNWIIDDEKTGEKRSLLSENIIGHGSATASVLWVDLENNIILTQSRRKGNEKFGIHFRIMVEAIEEELVNKSIEQIRVKE